MTRPMIRIHSLANNEIIDREMNDEEFAKYQEEQAELLKEKQIFEEAEAKRQVLLDKLGITEEEAKLLLGGN